MWWALGSRVCLSVSAIEMVSSFVHGVLKLSIFVAIAFNVTRRKHNPVERWRPAPGHGHCRMDVSPRCPRPHLHCVAALFKSQRELRNVFCFVFGPDVAVCGDCPILLCGLAGVNCRQVGSCSREGGGRFFSLSFNHPLLRERRARVRHFRSFFCILTSVAVNESLTLLLNCLL